jgi:hypothetical protein
MMSDTTVSRRFALHRVDERTWMIEHIDGAAHATDPVGHVTVTEDDQVEVRWDMPVPLPVLYATLEDALESLEDWAGRPRGATKPIPIPHFPPPPH